MAVPPVLIGAPTDFASFSISYAQKLMDSIPGRTFKQLNRTDELPDELPETLIYATHFPSQDVVTAISAGRLRPIYLLSPPTRDLLCFVHQKKQNVLAAMRNLTACCVANLAIARNNAAQIITRNDNIPVAELLASIEAALELKATPEQQKKAFLAMGHKKPLTVTVENVLNSARWSHDPSDEKWPEGKRQLSEVTAILTRLYRMAVDPTTSVKWPGTFLFLSDNPNHLSDEKISLIGPSRVLLYGPYMHLPPARYNVDVELVIGPGLEDTEFTLSILADSNPCIIVDLGAYETGTYYGSFEFEHTGAQSPIEIHLRSERGLIDGEISFPGVTFTPLPPAVTLEEVT